MYTATNWKWQNTKQVPENVGVIEKPEMVIGTNVSCKAAFTNLALCRCFGNMTHFQWDQRGL